MYDSMPKVIVNNGEMHEEVPITPDNWFKLLKHVRDNDFISDASLDVSMYRVCNKWVVEKQHQIVNTHDELEDTLTEFIERVKDK
jgi:hypothetical protein